MNEKYQEALEISEVWKSYFPGLEVAPQFWRLQLDKYPNTFIVAAIRRCVQKSLVFNGSFTLNNMLSYINSVCAKEMQKKVVSQ